jgi:hypothetical protein
MKTNYDRNRIFFLCGFLSFFLLCSVIIGIREAFITLLLYIVPIPILIIGMYYSYKNMDNANKLEIIVPTTFGLTFFSFSVIANFFDKRNPAPMNLNTLFMPFVVGFGIFIITFIIEKVIILNRKK